MKQLNTPLIFSIAAVFYLVAALLALVGYGMGGAYYQQGKYERSKNATYLDLVIGSPAESDSEEVTTAAEEELPAEPAEISWTLDENGNIIEVPAENPPAPEAPAQSERQFYRLITTTKEQILHLREKPDLFGKILYRLAIGTPGYVLQKGDGWSYIVAETKDGSKMGFAANRYLGMEPITPEELPAGYADIPIPEYEEGPY